MHLSMWSALFSNMYKVIFVVFIIWTQSCDSAPKIGLLSSHCENSQHHYVRDHVDCSIFYVCYRGRAWKMRCSPGTVWSTRYKVCVWDSSAYDDCLGEEDENSIPDIQEKPRLPPKPTDITPTHLKTTHPPVRWGRPIYTPKAPRKSLAPIIIKTTPTPKTKGTTLATTAVTTRRIFFPWTTRPPPRRTTKRPQRPKPTTKQSTTTSTTRAPTTTTATTSKTTWRTPRRTTIPKRTRPWQRKRTRRPWHRLTRKPWRTKKPKLQTPPPTRRPGRTTWKWWFGTQKLTTRKRLPETTTTPIQWPTTRRIQLTTRKRRPTTRKTRPTTRRTRPTTRRTVPTTTPTTQTPRTTTKQATTNQWRTLRPTTPRTHQPTSPESIYTKPTWNWWSRRVTKRPVTRTTRRPTTRSTTTLRTTTLPTTTTTTEPPTTTTRRTTPKSTRRSTKRTYPPWRYPPDQCGVVASTMIIGGRPSGPGRWPWQVSLQIIAAADPWHRCGGVLVDPLWVLTAAHCVEGPFYGNARNWRVVLSEDDLTRSSGREVYRRISRIVSHPGYLRASNFPNDIALLQLDDPVDVTGRYVRHACLPDREFSLSQDWNCWISGWGETRGTSRRYVLNELEVPILDNNNCSDMWSRVGIPVLSTQVCVGNGELGACYGDSGGPLMCEVDGVYVLGGVMSWLINNCTARNFPNVFTRVSSYIDWIYYNMDVYNFRRYS